MIFITLGDHCYFGITQDQRLFIRRDLTATEKGAQIDLGLATHKRFEEIREALTRLELHAIEEKVL